MTEIPEHLQKRAQKARELAAGIPALNPPSSGEALLEDNKWIEEFLDRKMAQLIESMKTAPTYIVNVEAHPPKTVVPTTAGVTVVSRDELREAIIIAALRIVAARYANDYYTTSPSGDELDIAMDQLDSALWDWKNLT